MRLCRDTDLVSNENFIRARARGRCLHDQLALASTCNWILNIHPILLVTVVLALRILATLDVNWLQSHFMPKETSFV